MVSSCSSALLFTPPYQIYLNTGSPGIKKGKSLKRRDLVFASFSRLFASCYLACSLFRHRASVCYSLHGRSVATWRLVLAQGAEGQLRSRAAALQRLDEPRDE